LNSPNIELDAQINKLELEWQRVYESSAAARAVYEALVTNESANADSLYMAGERLSKAEARKEQVLAIITRMEIRSRRPSACAPSFPSQRDRRA
jgi:hypothetical protein